MPAIRGAPRGLATGRGTEAEATEVRAKEILVRFDREKPVR
jgi:hypothetical protein